MQLGGYRADNLIVYFCLGVVSSSNTFEGCVEYLYKTYKEKNNK